MNVLHVKYAVEVARAGSLSKAAEVLFIAQPNLSRAIKDLESELGIEIFERTPKGMTPTPQGRDFLVNAERILREIRDLENLYIHGAPERQRFAISVPRASYIAAAFARFSNNISKDEAEIFYMETNSDRTIHNLLEEDYRLGIIRTSVIYEPVFIEAFRDKGIVHEEVVKFRFHIAFSKFSPLACYDKLSFTDLSNYIEITQADAYVPTIPITDVIKNELHENIRRRIFVFERASAYHMLGENPETFMLTTPLPDRIVEKFNLVERELEDNRREYKDILIYRNGYRLTETDLCFIRELQKEVKNSFGK